MYQANMNATNANLNAMNMGMGMGMGMGIPMMGTGAVFNNIFIYTGNPIGLQTRLESLTPNDAASIRQAQINLTGNQIKQMDTCCMICTAVWGGFLIFPMCFMCCDWWKKMVYPAYEVPESTYYSLQNLFSLPAIQSVTLRVVDNRLDANKCQILYNALSRAPSLKGFSFSNQTGMYDFQNNQYSKFQDNMRPIKKLPIMTEIKWGTNLVI